MRHKESILVPGLYEYLGTRPVSVLKARFLFTSHRIPPKVLKPEDFEEMFRGGRGGGRGGRGGRGGYRPQLGFTPDSHYRGGHRDMGPANRHIRYERSALVGLVCAAKGPRSVANVLFLVCIHLVIMLTPECSPLLSFDDNIVLRQPFPISWRLLQVDLDLFVSASCLAKLSLSLRFCML